MNEKTQIVDLGRAERPLFEPTPEVKGEFAYAAGLKTGDDPTDSEIKNGFPPDMSGGAPEGAWADAVGEEAVGGENPTPDQDVVEELGEAMGLTYQDNEPLGGEHKLKQRDENRWELNPASAESDSFANA